MTEPSTARAFWTVGQNLGEIRSEALRDHRGGEVIVRALFSAVSRGTESLVFTGRVPTSEYERMRAPFQAGFFPFPVKYGYISVGEVEQGPLELIGKKVFALYPHQTRYIVPVDAVTVLPDDVPAERAVLAANLETAINGVWDSGLQIGDRVAVVGGGTVGCLVAWVAKRAGATVQLVDRNPARRAIADALGVGFAPPADAAPDADVLLHCSGHSDGLDLALRLAAFESRVVELSWYGTTIVPLALGEAFHVKRLQLISSQVGHVAPSHRSRWTHARRLQLALSMLTDSLLDALITGESAFDDLPAEMVRLTEQPGNTLCHRIRY